MEREGGPCELRPVMKLDGGIGGERIQATARKRSTLKRRGSLTVTRWLSTSRLAVLDLKRLKPRCNSTLTVSPPDKATFLVISR